MSSRPAKAPNRTPQRARERFERRHARYRSVFPVLVSILSGSEHRQIDAHCRDLSEAGIGMLIAAELALGEVASLVFSIPGAAGPLQVRGVLRYRRGYHYGFEFLSLSEQQAEILAAVLPGLERLDADLAARGVTEGDAETEKPVT